MYNLDNFAAQVNPPSPQEMARRVRKIQQKLALEAEESREYPHSDERKPRSLLGRIARWLGGSRRS